MALLELVEEIATTKGLREALPFFASMVEETAGTSARSIIAAARGAGFSFRDTGAFNLIAQLKANLDIRERFKLTAFDQLPSLDSLERAVTPLRKDYSFLVSIKGLNPATGERERRFVTIVSDDLLTPETVIESALNLPSGSPGSQALTNTTITLESARISPLAL